MLIHSFLESLFPPSTLFPSAIHHNNPYLKATCRFIPFHLGLTPPELHKFQWHATSATLTLAPMIPPLALKRSTSIIFTSLMLNVCLPFYLPIPCLLFALFSLLPLVRIQLFQSFTGRRPRTIYLSFAINTSIQQIFSGSYYLPLSDPSTRNIKRNKTDQDPALKKLYLYFSGKR